MKKIPKLTSKILGPLQLATLKKFFKAPGAGDFFLTGGTALAGFYLFHRKSVDLDFFSLKKLDKAVLENAIKTIARDLKLDYQLLHFSTDTFYSVELKTRNESLKLDFVSDVPVQFGKIEDFDGDIRIDSLENIAVNKVTAIFGRTDPKDFVDLYFLLKNKKFDFEDLVSKAKKKDVGITEFYLAGALDNIRNITTLPEMLVPLIHEQLEKYFLKLSKDLFLQIKPTQ